MRYWFSIIIACYSLCVYGQQAGIHKKLNYGTVYFSDLNDRNYGETVTQFVGEMHGQLITRTAGKAEDTFVLYDGNMNLVKKNAISHQTFAEDKIEATYLGFLLNKGGTKCKALIQLVDKKSKMSTLYVATFDWNELKLSDWEKLSEVDGKRFSTSFLSGYDFANYAYSDDSTFIAVSHKLPSDGGKKVCSRVIVFKGNSFEEVWRKDFELADDSDASFKYDSSKGRMRANAKGEVYTCIREKSGSSYRDVAVIMNSSGMIKVPIIDDKGKFVLADKEWYSVPTQESSLRIFAKVADTTYSSALFSWSRGMEQGLIKKYSEKTRAVKSVIPLDNGGFIVQHGFTNISCFTNTGEPYWNISIPLRQEFKEDYVAMDGIMVYPCGDVCHIIYNDDIKNLGVLWHGRKQAVYQPSQTDHAVGAFATFNIHQPTEGLIESMWTGDEPGGYFALKWPGRSIQIGCNYYTYFQCGRGKERVVKVVLSN